MSFGENTPGGDPSDLLEAVSLVYFDANPTTIGPFEASRLRWKVDAPFGVQVELAGNVVSATGEMYVEPPATRNYGLVAKARNARRSLGVAQVNVDLGQCRAAPSLNFLDAFIKAAILADPGALPSGLYFREDPTVTIAPGRISIHLFLGKPIHWGIRDADVTLDMSFGLTVVPDTRPHTRGLGLAVTAGPLATRLAPTAEDYSGSASEPWYVYLIPVISIPLALALSMAQDSITARIPGIIQRVADGLDADLHPAGFDGLQKHSVTIGVDEKNIGYLDSNWCPPPPIRLGDA